jgi:hypothetical protein
MGTILTQLYCNTVIQTVSVTVYTETILEIVKYHRFICKDVAATEAASYM